MTLRDRRGPLAAILLAVAYALVLSAVFSHILVEFRAIAPLKPSPLLQYLLVFTLADLMRATFTAREYGFIQGVIAIPRTLVSNIIAIMSGRRAIAAYWRTLRGSPVVWDKTDHRDHPALALEPQVAG